MTRGVDVSIGGKAVWNSGAYSVVEDSTPVSPADSSGGYGQITIPVRDAPAVKSLDGKTLALSDGRAGRTSGIVRGLSGNGLTAQVVADSRLSATGVIRQAAPFVGTLGDAVRYYLSLCGVTSGIVVDEEIDPTPVTIPGWRANVFDQLKKFATARRFEIALVSDNIVVRPLRQRVAERYRDSTLTWSMDGGNLAQRVEGYAYEMTSGTGLVYPPGGWSEGVTIYTVDAGQLLEVTLDIEASLSSVEQPDCVLFVDQNHAATSVYSVTGKDGAPIPPAQWKDGGGGLSVAISEDTRSLILTIQGSAEAEYAPYRISVASGTGDHYSSLRIRGEGVFFTKELLSAPACLNADRAPNEIGATIDNEFYEGRGSLMKGLIRAAAGFASPRRTINVTARGINRLGQTGSYTYPTIGDLAALHPGATIGSLRATAGFDGTVGEWNASLRDLVDDGFDNQAFGNVGGARLDYDGSWYRIRTATITPNSIQYTAEADATIGDAFGTGETIGQWNARWAGATIGDVNAAPMAGISP